MPLAPDKSFLPAPVQHCAYDEFLTASLGTTLMLKAAGFVESQQARILDVDETQLALRIGSPWWAKFLPLGAWQPPIEVKLRFQVVEHPPLHAPRIPQSMVTVSLKPASRFVDGNEFERYSRRLLWQLRYHFMANV